MQLAPIVLFTYNRLKHTIKTIEALKHNMLASESDLIVFSDAAANTEAEVKVNEVRTFLKSITGFRKVQVIERKINYGLGDNIIDGVTQIINQYGKIIVLEDDLITSPFFLQYMNDALLVYADKKEVTSVHGYVYPIKEKLPDTFFLKGADCLGWGTWKRAWDTFETDGKVLLQKLVETAQTQDFDFGNAYPYTQMLRDQITGKNKSWAVRWYASAFINNLYTLYPGQSLVFHAGGDGSGTNTGFDDLLNVELSNKPVPIQMIEVKQNETAYKAFQKFHSKLHRPPLLYRLKRKWKKLTS